MSPAPPDARARALPFLAFFLLVVGSCEMYSGVGQLGTTGYLPLSSEGVPEANEHLREAGRLMADSPHRGPLGVAQIAAGAMLLIAGLLFLRASASAVWWAKQSLAAAILVTAGTLATSLLHFHQNRHRLIQELRAVAAVTPEGPTASQRWDGIWVRTGIASALMLMVFFYVLWRITRPDVRAALADHQRDR